MDENRTAIPSDERAATLAMAAVLLALGVFWIFASLRIPTRMQVGPVSHTIVPVSAGIFLALVSALLLVRYWRTPSRPTAELGQSPLFVSREQIRVLTGFLALLVYVLILPSVHYLVSTFLITAVGLYLTGEPLKRRLLLVAAVISGLLFWIFVLWLGVPLPGGRFG